MISETSRLTALLQEWSELLPDLSLPDSKQFEEELQQVWAASDYTARSCLRYPRVLEQLIADGLLDNAYVPGQMSAQLDELRQDVADEDALAVSLRQFRRQQMMRIIWRDITRKADLGETLEDLSELADVSIRCALAFLYSWSTEKFGVPRNAEAKPQSLIVLGMGKLGARELNLSSDIDLIYSFPEHGQTDGRRSLANEQFFTQLGRKLVNALSKQTADGFVFRVDMRLRPFGEAGPLAISFGAMENYYQSQAREWERYAMVKARPITGPEADQAALMDILRPFVYRRYVDFGAINAIREMKRLIRQEMHKRGMDANIKLGRGGIREIEFMGQAFQLVRGGRDAELQVRPILEVLEKLAKRQLMPTEAVSDLTSAYVFLRLTENRIQAWKDEQTHLLPEDEAGRQRLAESMRYDDWELFESELNCHRDRVDSHFLQVFSTPVEGGDEPPSALAVVWEGSDQELAEIEMAEAGFKAPEEGLKLLGDFRGSAACRSMSARARGKLDQLMPVLLQAIATHHAPDTTLERLVRLLQSIVRRTAYIDLLLENPAAMNQLVRLGSESSWVLSQLIRHPVLLDELLDPRRLYSPLRRSELDAEVAEMLDKVDDEDLEQQMERLRQFADSNRLRTAAADITGVIPLMVVSDYLTEIAEASLEQIVCLAWGHLTARHGRPGGMNTDGSGFVVLGYGKLGGIELGYGSDLDMVFLHESYPATAMTDGNKPVANDVFFVRLGQRIVHLLTTRTPSGILYDADMRLRPNGNSGMLVTSLEAFERYQLKDAWAWEHQALVRARPVAGDELLMTRFEVSRRHILGQGRNEQELRSQVVDMREKMRATLDRSNKGQFDLKQGKGGIADIEFMVQYSVLRWAHEHPELLDWTDNIRLLDSLAQADLLHDLRAELLANAYRVFRAIYHRAALQELPGMVPMETLTEERNIVAEIWDDLMLTQVLTGE
jgi:glutamate-ammonia-ligase adenylyltransferase